MTMEAIVNNNQDIVRNRINPHKFALWAGMASILMMFMGWTSAYIIKQAGGNWIDYRIPDIFFLSTGIIILSSITLHTSYRSFLNGKEGLYKSLLVFTGILGVVFVFTQYFGWSHMFNIGIDLKANPSGSFFYLITAAHALHVLAGVAAIVVACFHAFALKYKVTEKRKNRFELVLHYWHFVDILWVYLLAFLILSK